METQAVRAEIDPSTKRYVATCPKCGHKFERSKRESAEHNLALHIGYEMCPK
jgi:predicted RNA-binding Zn-ribbon protein involved in translation (DUF1610 family)